MERWLGRRFFRRLTDQQLIAWRPADGRFHEGNFSACNREVECRAAKVGLSPHAWVSITVNQRLAARATILAES